MTTETEKLISEIIDDAEEVVVPVDAGATPGVGKSKASQTDCLIELAAQVDLFHTPDGEGYADIQVDGHRETWALDSAGFKKWLRHAYYSATGSAANQNAMAEACRTIEAKAQFNSPTRNVYLRVAEFKGRLYLDLANDTWQVVEIDSLGWRLVDDPPVRFRRTKGMRPTPPPQPGGSIDALRGFVNVKSDSDFVLAVSWILAALRNRGPYAVLVVAGEQGSAKSTFSKMLRDLVDANAAPRRSVPRSVQDIYISANNGHVLAFDNVSHLPVWLSDTLCQLASGGGFAARALYTDDEEKLFSGARPIVLNGIVDFVERPDLANRALFLELEPIPDDQRRPEDELDAAFAAARPMILGALLDALVEGLRRMPEIHLEGHPRMADFAKWATACETAFWPPGTFMAAYTQNRKGAVEQVLDVDPVADTIRSLMTQHGEWRGTASELLDVLTRITNERTANSRSWPPTSQELSKRLKRAATFLRSTGIDISHWRDGHDRSRIIRIVLCCENQESVISAPANDDEKADGDCVSNGPACPPPKPMTSNANVSADKADDESQAKDGTQFDVVQMAALL